MPELHGEEAAGNGDGARGDGTEGTPSEMLPATLPGDSVRSARIERTVSAWNTPAPTLPAARPEARMPRSASLLDVRTEPAPSEEGLNRHPAHRRASGEGRRGRARRRRVETAVRHRIRTRPLPRLRRHPRSNPNPARRLSNAPTGRRRLRNAVRVAPPCPAGTRFSSASRIVSSRRRCPARYVNPFYGKKRQAVRIMRHRRDTFGIETVTPRQSGRECPFPAPSASHAHPADASPCRSGCANPRRSPSLPPIPARHRAST